MRRQLIALVTAALAGAGTAAFGAPALADTRDDQWHLKYLKVAEAHRISTGKGVTVAVIDSGVAKHPDLPGVVSGTDLVKPGGDGRTDVTGHGTSMAGLIAAHGNGRQHALGIAPDAKILPIRVLGKGKTVISLGPAIRYAISHGAKVINMSIGGGIDPDDLAGIKEAEEADVVLIASAGNKPDAVSVSAPAFLDGVVAVGAVDRSGNHAKISVSGSALDIAAPGEDITSTNREGGYNVRQEGTSQAAAIVSGAAALLRSKYPNMSATEVVERLESTAIDKGAPGVDPDYGHGIIDIVAALSDSTTPEPSASAAPSGTTAAPAPTTTTSAASPEAEPAGSSTPLIIGGVAVLVLLGGLAAFLLTRRRAGRETRGPAGPPPPRDL
ncbi:type VII secretion-associated serine protease mycosin [Actinoplanes sp. ATCC 53533]|uniref:type VII secretion-associated serine protease mycosin n=1 Tax=Actinoplanes sp. ATCC 53533 TaxID=1288362 RepID=UPI000F7A2971|nr:type VII secretion-associated serine protease mycosin [Actinoplanes sp. ATCC 53533]RSM65179.1 type VII secretion-associated serine protease mycosin [Actinoplanes sp. ATCC 53533]